MEKPLLVSDLKLNHRPTHSLHPHPSFYPSKIAHNKPPNSSNTLRSSASLNYRDKENWVSRSSVAYKTVNSSNTEEKFNHKLIF